MKYAQKRKPKKGDWAFWSYDAFPFLLWGKIKKTEQEEKGKTIVHIDGYEGMRFRPAFTLPPVEGEKVAVCLDQLRDDHRERMDKAKKVSRIQMRAVLRNLNLPVTDTQRVSIAKIEEG